MFVQVCTLPFTFLRYQEFHCPVRQSPLLIHIFSQVNSIHNPSSDFLTIHFNSTLYSTPVFRKGQIFLLKLCTFLLSLVSATCPTYLILTAMMNLLACSVSQYFFSFLFPNIPLRNLFSYSFTCVLSSACRNKFLTPTKEMAVLWFYISYVNIVNQISPGPLPRCCQLFVYYHRISLNYAT